MDLSDQDIQTLIEYARRKVAEERYPFDPALEPIRRNCFHLRNRQFAGVPIGADWDPTPNAWPGFG